MQITIETVQGDSSIDHKEYANKYGEQSLTKRLSDQHHYIRVIELYTPEKNGEYTHLSFSEDQNDFIGIRTYANNYGEQSITR